MIDIYFNPLSKPYTPTTIHNITCKNGKTQIRIEKHTDNFHSCAMDGIGVKAYRCEDCVFKNTPRKLSLTESAKIVSSKIARINQITEQKRIVTLEAYV
jgi:hypothetical protein